jgi:hypothetical protein
MLIKKAVCMHEEDAGLLWKHVEYRTNHSEVRRSRRLVLSFVATVLLLLPFCLVLASHIDVPLRNFPCVWTDALVIDSVFFLLCRSPTMSMASSGTSTRYVPEHAT